MRWLAWPLCALFGHEALGLLSTRERFDDRDSHICMCGRHEMYGSYVARMLPGRAYFG